MIPRRRFSEETKPKPQAKANPRPKTIEQFFTIQEPRQDLESDEELPGLVTVVGEESDDDEGLTVGEEWGEESYALESSDEDDEDDEDLRHANYFRRKSDFPWNSVWPPPESATFMDPSRLAAGDAMQWASEMRWKYLSPDVAKHLRKHPPCRDLSFSSMCTGSGMAEEAISSSESAQKSLGHKVRYKHNFVAEIDPKKGKFLHETCQMHRFVASRMPRTAIQKVRRAFAMGHVQIQKKSQQLALGVEQTWSSWGHLAVFHSSK